MDYKKRLTKPEAGNKYYIKTPNGYSLCCYGNNDKGQRDKNLDVLPNCVGYALGRFNEISNLGNFKNGIPGNAEDLYANAIKQGLSVGSEPKVGALLVWRKGEAGNSADGCGHVVVVEEVHSSSEIVVSQSGWSAASPFWTAKHLKGSDGEWIQGDDYSWMKGRYNFVGFVYNPELESILKEEKSALIKKQQEELKRQKRVSTNIDNVKKNKNIKSLFDKIRKKK